ncbi:uncharacterized protein [Dendrobates tinctorius]|uniref:uncharacterized protein isoform X2 n=1 Tax=Dendrobates tinctorius TaxID=92724 RepID=UPI003CCA6204
MASASGRGAAARAPCRAFLRGACRWGPNCRFTHETQYIPVCRHFGNGFCSYGDRCSFLHLPQGHRSDLPSHHPDTRRVSEPSIVPFVPNPRVGRRVSEPSVTTLQSNPFEHRTVPVQLPREDWALAPEFVPRNAGLFRSSSSPILTGKSKEPECQDETNKRTSLKTLHSKRENSGIQYERSKDVVCGICMDKVYDKQIVQDRVFGILPNCSHAYCVGCIKRWRKTRDFQHEVIKGCPQCRVKSSYFIPHRYWIEDTDEKVQLIEDFKEKTGLSSAVRSAADSLLGAMGTALLNLNVSIYTICHMVSYRERGNKEGLVPLRCLILSWWEYVKKTSVKKMTLTFCSVL